MGAKSFPWVVEHMGRVFIREDQGLLCRRARMIVRASMHVVDYLIVEGEEPGGVAHPDDLLEDLVPRVCVTNQHESFRAWAKTATLLSRKEQELRKWRLHRLTERGGRWHRGGGYVVMKSTRSPVLVEAAPTALETHPNLFATTVKVPR